MKKILSISLFLAIALSMVTTVCAGTFPDTDNHWADGDIIILKCTGMAHGIPTIVDGQEVNLFCPDKDTTRAEIAKFLSRSLKLTQYSSSNNAYDDAFALGMDNHFSDVHELDWFYLDIIIVKNAGIMNGYPDGTFLPNEPVTREETAQIISNYIDFINQYRDEKNVIEKGNVTENYADDSIISEWAKPAVYALPFIQGSTGNQVMYGYPDGTFRPQHHLTRGSAAAVLVWLGEVRK